MKTILITKKQNLTAVIFNRQPGIKKLFLKVRVVYHFFNILDDFDITGPPYFGFNANSMTLFIKTIPKNIARWDIKE